MKLKRIISLLLIISFCLFLASCNDKSLELKYKGNCIIAECDGSVGVFNPPDVKELKQETSSIDYIVITKFDQNVVENTLLILSKYEIKNLYLPMDAKDNEKYDALFEKCDEEFCAANIVRGAYSFGLGSSTISLYCDNDKDEMSAKLKFFKVNGIITCSSFGDGIKGFMSDEDDVTYNFGKLSANGEKLKDTIKIEKTISGDITLTSNSKTVEISK